MALRRSLLMSCIFFRAWIHAPQIQKFAGYEHRCMPLQKELRAKKQARKPQGACPHKPLTFKSLGTSHGLLSAPEKGKGAGCLHLRGVRTLPNRHSLATGARQHIQLLCLCSRPELIAYELHKHMYVIPAVNTLRFCVCYLVQHEHVSTSVHPRGIT